MKWHAIDESFALDGDQLPYSQREPFQEFARYISGQSNDAPPENLPRDADAKDIFTQISDAVQTVDPAYEAQLSNSYAYLIYGGGGRKFGEELFADLLADYYSPLEKKAEDFLGPRNVNDFGDGAVNKANILRFAARSYFARVVVPEILSSEPSGVIEPDSFEDVYSDSE
ncbi:hypothetical protein [Streptomyces sp. 1222.5]|uniref:hypothetical protein n=1 Tax=Streptomyces sp. 1222.5 TaxID=1881026 RepID=UPI003D7544AB